MSLIDDIKRDREAGTRGSFKADMGEAFHIRDNAGGRIAQMVFLKGRHGLGGRRDGNEVASNARRIARVPQMEAALLAADALADAYAQYRDRPAMDNPDDWRRMDETLAAYREAAQ